MYMYINVNNVCILCTYIYTPLHQEAIPAKKEQTHNVCRWQRLAGFAISAHIATKPQSLQIPLLDLGNPNRYYAPSPTC